MAALKKPARRTIVDADQGIAGALFAPEFPVSAEAPLLLCVHGSGCHGGYFDLASNSLVAAATARGLPVLLLDRPGHGASSPPPPGSALDQGVAAIAALLAAARVQAPDLAERPFALIGHSFGGAIALCYAATERQSAPLGVTVSGIGDRPDAGYAAERLGADAAARPAPYWLFGPGSSYDWRGITALRAAAAPWRASEVEEVIGVWPARWPEVAAAITCPVQLRLAEFERIWEVGPAAVARMAGALLHAPHVDVALAEGGGHLYEAHLRGPELIAAQLDFIQDVAASLG